MTELLAFASSIVTFLFGNGTTETGLVVIVAKTMIDEPVLALPVVIMIVGLGVGFVGRLINTVRG